MESKQPEQQKKLKVEKINEHILVIIKNTLEAISEAYKCGKITLEDYNEMLAVIQNLNDYFIDNYNYYKGLSKEVETMFKSFYDPEVERRGAQKEKENIARNFLRDGISCELIAKNTGLPLEKVKELAKEVLN